MEKLTICDECEHFKQHYQLSSKGASMVGCGHCTKFDYGRRRLYNMKSCPEYRQTESSKIEDLVLREMILKIEQCLLQVNKYIDFKHQKKD